MKVYFTAYWYAMWHLYLLLLYSRDVISINLLNRISTTPSNKLLYNPLNQCQRLKHPSLGWDSKPQLRGSYSNASMYTNCEAKYWDIYIKKKLTRHFSCYIWGIPGSFLSRDYIYQAGKNRSIRRDGYSLLISTGKAARLWIPLTDIFQHSPQYHQTNAGMVL